MPPWAVARRTSLSFTISWSLLKVKTIESMMPSNHLILCRPLLLPLIFPSIRVFSNESAPLIKWQSIGASASASVLPMNIQGWFLLGLTDLISLQSKGLSRIFFSTIISPKFHAAYRKTEVTRSQIRYYVVEPEWDSSPLDFKVHDLSIRLICLHKVSGLLIKLLPHPF